MIFIQRRLELFKAQRHSKEATCCCWMVHYRCVQPMFDFSSFKIKIKCLWIHNLLLHLLLFWVLCVLHATWLNGLDDIVVPYCPLILSLVIAYLKSSILKSERWMTAVIKLCYDKRKMEKNRYCRSIHRQTDIYIYSPGLSVVGNVAVWVFLSD